MRCATGAGAPATGASRQRFPAQSDELVLEIGRQHGGVLKPRVAYGDVRKLAGQLDQRRWQQMWWAQRGPKGRDFGQFGDGDKKDSNDGRFISERSPDSASVENRSRPRPGLRVACTGMLQQGDDAARLAVFDELRRSAIDTYGEERIADANLAAALNLAATAVWRVSQEPLEPLGDEPLPTHG
jgi:hypothetical protein